jgi:hypothetical protein
LKIRGLHVDTTSKAEMEYLEISAETSYWNMTTGFPRLPQSEILNLEAAYAFFI